MKFKHTVIATLLVASTSLGVISASAAGPTENSQITIDVKATTIQATVPTTTAIVFNADETVTVPTNFDITNNSALTNLSIVKITLDGGTGWKLAADTKDLKLNGSDIKEAHIKMGKPGTTKTIAPTTGVSDKTGSATWTNGSLGIKPKSKQNIAFEVQRGAFSAPVAQAKAYGIVINFEFTK